MSMLSFFGRAKRDTDDYHNAINRAWCAGYFHGLDNDAEETQKQFDKDRARSYLRGLSQGRADRELGP